MKCVYLQLHRCILFILYCVSPRFGIHRDEGLLAELSGCQDGSVPGCTKVYLEVPQSVLKIVCLTMYIFVSQGTHKYFTIS